MEQFLINLILLSLCCWALLHTFTVKAKVDKIDHRVRMDKDAIDIVINELLNDVTYIEDCYNYLVDERATTEDDQINNLAKKYSNLVETYTHNVHFDGMTDDQRRMLQEYAEYILKASMYGLLYPESEEE